MIKILEYCRGYTILTLGILWKGRNGNEECEQL